MTAITTEEAIAVVRERLAPLRPAQVIVFGSRARGDEREDSDPDVLVVLDRIDDERAARREVGRALEGVPIAKDALVASREQIERADDDFEAAERIADNPAFAPRWACCLAKRAADKAMKARTVPCELGPLSQWEIGSRHPGDWGEAGADDAHRAIALARAVVEAAREDAGGAG